MKEENIKIWDNYISSGLNLSNKDANANANVKNLSNFIMELAHDTLEDITRHEVNRKYMEIFKEDGEVFWEDEYRSKTNNRPAFYFHDMTRGLIPYCYAASTYDILKRGRFYPSEFKSLPPKRFDSFIGQVTEFIMELSQEHAGAIAVPDFLINLASFFQSRYEIRKNKVKLENSLQSMIFILHNKFRIQSQSPFVNVTICDEVTLRDVFGVADKNQISIINDIQELFVNLFIKGNGSEPFRFPVTTINISCDKKTREINDIEFVKKYSKVVATGLVNVYVSDDTRKFASCCRMVNDVTQMYGIDSFGNGGINVGSTRVIALSLPELVDRIKKGNKDAIKDAVTVVCKALKAHKELLRENIDKGFLRFFTAGIEHLDKNYFSTIGYLGLYEAAISLCDNPEDLKEVALKERHILSMINKVKNPLAKQLNLNINLEQIPGESACYKMADKFYGEKGHCFSNQFLPLSSSHDIMSRIKIAGDLDKESSGGSITHINLSEQISEDQALELIKCAAKHGLTHFAPNFVFTVCDCGKRDIGYFEKCRSCSNEKVSHITRIIGYLSPLENWSVERRVEYKTRNWNKV